MDALPTDVVAWLKEYRWLLGWVGVGSLVLLLGSLAGTGWLLARLPSDYFVRDDDALGPQHPLLRTGAVLARNVAGIVLLVAGTAMLVLPGQGLLTILVGLILVNFPGKQALIRRILRQPAVRRTVDRLRERAGRDPLELGEG